MAANSGTDDSGARGAVFLLLTDFLAAVFLLVGEFFVTVFFATDFFAAAFFALGIAMGNASVSACSVRGGAAGAASLGVEG
jgi:hypothetical protein